MGKRLLQQRAGRGGINFRSPSWRRVGKARIPPIEGEHVGKVIDIVHNPGTNAPLALIKLDDGTKFYVPSVQGLIVGQKIQIGKNASISNGNIVEVGNVPEGTIISNIEKIRGDGGKFARSAGTYGIVVGKSGDKVLVKLSSEKIAQVSSNARAIVGIVAGGGVTENHSLKLGTTTGNIRLKQRNGPM